MAESLLKTELSPRYAFERMELSGKQWQKAAQFLHPLEVKTFGDKGFDIEVLEDSLQQPHTVLITVRDGDNLIGFTYATPLSYMEEEMQNIERADKGEKTAYVFDTVVDENYRGKKITPPMMDLLMKELADEGYEFVERDTAVDAGYADQVQKTYEQQGLMIKVGPEHSSEWGTQRFMRMRIPKPQK